MTRLKDLQRQVARKVRGQAPEATRDELDAIEAAQRRGRLHLANAAAWRLFGTDQARAYAAYQSKSRDPAGPALWLEEQRVAEREAQPPEWALAGEALRSDQHALGYAREWLARRDADLKQRSKELFQQEAAIAKMKASLDPAILESLPALVDEFNASVSDFQTDALAQAERKNMSEGELLSAFSDYREHGDGSLEALSEIAAAKVRGET